MISALRTWLLAGLLVLVPLMITVAVLNWVVSTLDETLRILPAQWQPEVLLGFYIPGLGVLFALIILLLIGAATSNFIGKKLVNWWDGLLNRIPVVRSVYAAVKQVSDTLFSNKGNAFRKALLIQWPREGLWTVAFLTGKPGSTVNNQLGDGYISVYGNNKVNLVKEGDSIKRGQKIAELGNTESTQVKLHFELRRDSKPIDPTSYFEQ